MIGTNDLLVPIPCSGGEVDCVVRVELAAMYCVYMEAMNSVVWWQGFIVVARLSSLGSIVSSLKLTANIRCFAVAQLPPRGSHIVMRLYHVPLDCIV